MRGCFEISMTQTKGGKKEKKGNKKRRRNNRKSVVSHKDQERGGEDRKRYATDGKGQRTVTWVLRTNPKTGAQVCVSKQTYLAQTLVGHPVKKSLQHHRNMTGDREGMRKSKKQGPNNTK